MTIPEVEEAGVSAETAPKLTNILASALSECARYCAFPNAPPFWWRRASMKKLEAMGLVEAWKPLGPSTGSVAYRPTDLGRAALRTQESSNDQ